MFFTVKKVFVNFQKKKFNSKVPGITKKLNFAVPAAEIADFLKLNS